MSKELIEGIEARRKARGFYMPEDIKDLGDRIEALEAENTNLRNRLDAHNLGIPMACADSAIDAAKQWEAKVGRLRAELAALKEAEADWQRRCDAMERERAAIRAQKPVAWLYPDEQSFRKVVPAGAEYLDERLDRSGRAIPLYAATVQKLPFGKSDSVHHLAENIMIDCGCSTEYTALRDKIEGRLWEFFDAAMKEKP